MITYEEGNCGEVEPVSYGVAPPVVMACSAPMSGGPETIGQELSAKPAAYTTYYTMASPMTYATEQPLVMSYGAPVVGVAQPITATETALETSPAQTIATYTTTRETPATQPMTTYKTSMPMNYTTAHMPVTYSGGPETIAPSYVMG